MDNTSHLCARASLEIDIIVTQAKFTVHILLQFSTVGQFFRLTLWLWLIFPEYLRLADNESVECFTLPLTILSKANKNLNDIGPRLRFTSFLACALTSIFTFPSILRADVHCAPTSIFLPIGNFPHLFFERTKNWRQPQISRNWQVMAATRFIKCRQGKNHGRI